jgi:molybdopterin-guanine dinucleotide biosynthesis protein A
VVSRAFVLAGGASKRFGQDKASYLVNGKPMVMWVVEAIRAAGLSVSLVVRDASLRGLGVPLIVEPESVGHYPLRGVLAGLEALKAGETALFCPCDLPFLTEKSVQQMAGAVAPAVAFDGERVHPLLALLGTGAVGALLEHISNQGSATAFFEGAERVLLPTAELRNVNRVGALSSANLNSKK